MKFPTKSELKKLSQKEIKTLWDKSDKFAKDVEKEYYRRENARIDNANRELNG